MSLTKLVWSPPPSSTRTRHQDIHITSLARGTGFQRHQRIWQSDPTSVSFAAWWTRGEFYKGHLAGNHQGSLYDTNQGKSIKITIHLPCFLPTKIGYLEGSLIIRIVTHIHIFLAWSPLAPQDFPWKNVHLGIQVILVGWKDHKSHGNLQGFSVKFQKKISGKESRDT